MRLSYIQELKHFLSWLWLPLNTDFILQKGSLCALTPRFILRNAWEKFGSIEHILWKIHWLDLCFALFFCPFLFSDKRQATETEKEGEIFQRTQKKRMERCYEQIKIIVILAITFDLRFLRITVTQTLLHGSIWGCTLRLQGLVWNMNILTIFWTFSS